MDTFQKFKEDFDFHEDDHTIDAAGFRLEVEIPGMPGFGETSEFFPEDPGPRYWTSGIAYHNHQYNMHLSKSLFTIPMESIESIVYHEIGHARVGMMVFFENTMLAPEMFTVPLLRRLIKNYRYQKVDRRHFRYFRTYCNLPYGGIALSIDEYRRDCDMVRRIMDLPDYTLAKSRIRILNYYRDELVKAEIKGFHRVDILNELEADLYACANTSFEITIDTRAQIDKDAEAYGGDVYTKDLMRFLTETPESLRDEIRETYGAV